MSTTKVFESSIQDTLCLYGDFFMRVYDVAPDGTRKLRFRFAKKNQITDDGRLTILGLMSQVALGGTEVQMHPEYGQIWSLSIGDGPLPPASSQHALVSPVWTVALDIALGERAYNAGAFQLNIHKEIPVGDATGSTFAEAGLFTRGSQAAPGGLYPTWQDIPERMMYARQIFPSFEKGATMSVVFDWTLGMTVA
jgi:hypothetical protein